MRRPLPLLLLLASCSLSSLGGGVGLPCERDEACPPDAPVCVDGACAAAGDEGEGEGGADVPPRIDLVDGDGTLLAPRVEPQPGQQFAARRLGNLVVTGDGLRAADVVVVDEAAIATPLVVLSESPVRLTLAPAFPHAGLFTLLVTTSLGTAQAQVFVLQGEPGAPGEPGASAPLTCDEDGRCRLNGTLEVDDLEVNGSARVAGRAVAARLEGSTQVTATTEAELLERLDEIDGVAIPQGTAYVISLPVASLTLTAPVVIDHPDGARLSILGASPVGGRTVISAAGSAIVVFGGGLANLNNVELVGPGANAGLGVQVSASRAQIGGNVLVRNFQVGFFSSDGATINIAAGAIAQGCNNGYFAFAGSTLRAVGTSAQQNVVAGYLAQFESSLLIASSVSSGNLRGVQVLQGSSAQISGATITGNQAEGLFVNGTSHVIGGQCTINNNHVVNAASQDVAVVGNSLFEAGGCTLGTTLGDISP